MWWIELLKWLACVVPLGIAFLFFLQPIVFAIILAGAAIPSLMADSEEETKFYAEESARLFTKIFKHPHPILFTILGFVFMAISLFCTLTFYYS